MGSIPGLEVFLSHQLYIRSLRILSFLNHFRLTIYLYLRKQILITWFRKNKFIKIQLMVLFWLSTVILDLTIKNDQKIVFYKIIFSLEWKNNSKKYYFFKLFFGSKWKNDVKIIFSKSPKNNFFQNYFFTWNQKIIWKNNIFWNYFFVLLKK